MPRAIVAHGAHNAYHELNTYGVSHQTILATLKNAERNGVASVRDIIVSHVGYDPHATRFDASTGLYRITFA